ncbi:hypothetical protein RIF29_23354 [Crotalaria pallida]|uniref:Uncharacterized protein n=1 Tax=Crotalaria pallida TaxID=3830 RepID=A0AAN9F853_CROPI
MKSRGLHRLGVIASTAIVWTFAEILTAAGAYNKRSQRVQLSCRSDRSGLISASPWIRVPRPFQWGRPSFHVSSIFPAIAASLVATVESTGMFIAAARLGSATPIPPSVLGRGVGWLGIGTLMDAFFGAATGSTASV